jgi:hypothetical protein
MSKRERPHDAPDTPLERVDALDGLVDLCRNLDARARSLEEANRVLRAQLDRAHARLEQRLEEENGRLAAENREAHRGEALNLELESQRLATDNQRLRVQRSRRARRLEDKLEHSSPAPPELARAAGARPFLVWTLAGNAAAIAQLVALGERHPGQMTQYQGPAPGVDAVACYTVHADSSSFARLLDPDGRSRHHFNEMLNHPTKRQSYKSVSARYLAPGPLAIEA